MHDIYAADISQLTLLSMEIIDPKTEYVSGDQVKMVFRFDQPFGSAFGGYIKYGAETNGQPALHQVKLTKFDDQTALATIDVDDTLFAGVHNVFNVSVFSQWGSYTKNNVLYSTENSIDLSALSFVVANAPGLMESVDPAFVTINSPVVFSGEEYILNFDFLDLDRTYRIGYAFAVDGVAMNGSYSCDVGGSNDSTCHSSINHYYDTSGVYELYYISVSDPNDSYRTLFSITNEKYTTSNVPTMNFDSASFLVTGTLNDNVAPVFHSLQISSEHFYLNECLNVKVSATDDQLGVRRVDISLYNIDSGNYSYVNIEGSLMEGDIYLIDSNAEGHYAISTIDVTDRSHNVARYYNSDLYGTPSTSEEDIRYIDLSNYDFDVLPAQFNDVSTEFLDFQVSPNPVEFGSSPQFSITVSSLYSDAEYIYVNFNRPFQLYADGPVSINPRAVLYNNGGGVFSGGLEGNDFDNQSGYYVVSNIEIHESEMTTFIYEIQSRHGIKVADFSGLQYEMKNPDEIIDTTAPILDSLTVNNSSATVDDFVSFSTQAHDDESYLTTIVLSFRVDGQKTPFQLYLFNYENEGFTSSDGIWIGQFERSGLWEIDSVDLYSHGYGTVYNSKFYSGEEVAMDFTSASFSVYGTTFDNRAPELLSFNTSKEIAYQGDRVELDVGFMDNISGVSNIEVHWVGPTGLEEIVQIDRNEATSGSGIFTIRPTTKSGRWEVDSVVLLDYAGNQVTYRNQNLYEYCASVSSLCFDFGTYGFEVVGTIEDKIAPVLTNVISPFDTYITDSYARISIVSESSSYVSAIELTYWTLQGNIVLVNYYDGSDHETYDFEISELYYNTVGDWTLNKVRLTDVFGNTSTYRNGTVDDPEHGILNLSMGNFRVIGSNLNPHIQSITLSDNNVTVGDEVVIGLDLFSNIIKPDEVVLKYLTSNNYTEETITLVRNEQGKYSGKLLVSEWKDSGIWQITKVEFRDRYWNLYEIYNRNIYAPEGKLSQDLDMGNLSVYGTILDNSAPEVYSATVDKLEETIASRSNQASFMSILSEGNTLDFGNALFEGKTFTANDRIAFRIDGMDDHSGIDHMIITYEVLNKKITFEVKLQLNQDNLYEGYANIENYYPEGIWIIDRFELVDSAGNSYVRTRDVQSPQNGITGLNNLQFLVVGTMEDQTSPSFESIELNSTSLNLGETLYISAQASDAYSGVKTFDIYVKPIGINDNRLTRRIRLERMDDGGYQGEMKITENTLEGSWVVTKIEIADFANNTLRLLNYAHYATEDEGLLDDLSMYDFTVTLLESLTLLSLPNTLEIEMNSELDLSGMLVQGNYSDGSTLMMDLSKGFVYGFDPSVITDNQTVYLVFGEKYVEFNLSIVEDKLEQPPIITIRNFDATTWTNQSVVVCASVDHGELNEACHTFIENGSFEFVATDNSGNESRQTVIISNIDKTLPTISVSQNSKFTLKSIGSILYLAFDLESGLVGEGSGTISVDTSKIGNYSISVSVMDQAGNLRTEEVRYQVVYDFLGFMQPINSNGTSIFKAGSTIPIKFKLGDFLGINQSDAIASLTVTRLGDNVDGSVNELPINTAASSTAFFRYDDLSGQYILNLSTKGYPAGRYQLSVNLNDGTIHSIEIGLKK